jgi:N-acetylglucosaminyl-diphospho-decaprenol L-rhamnosyltransferase
MTATATEHTTSTRRSHMRAPALEIVIVAYRCRDLLRRCLASLERDGLMDGDCLVHVVDNASRDGTAELVRSAFPRARLHELDRNAGFSTANNVALRHVSAPFVLLLNPDTESEPGAVAHLLEAMGCDASIGMAGCRLVQPDGTFDHAAKRAFPTPLGALGHFLGVGRRRSSPKWLSQYRATVLDETGAGDVDAINGAFMLVRREALESVGLLDEGYWLYMEDLDWCKRFHLAGWRVVYDGRVTFMHVKGGTSGQLRGWRQNVAFHRGMGRFYRKFEAGPRPALDAAVYTGIVGKLVVSLVQSEARRRAARFTTRRKGRDDTHSSN